ncbi:MAG: SIMPL domain-containing protein [Planctomycetaceae bacterium]|nr:SIMPL domain-containing protein [Planctomycetaceae bacterium]
MCRFIGILLICTSALWSLASPLSAQEFDEIGSPIEASPLDRKTAQEVITITGTAEIRFVPDQIRIVLAVISDADSAVNSRNIASMKVEELQRNWVTGLKFKKESIAAEFISLQPHYQSVEKIENGRQSFEPARTGFRTQYNVHVVVDTEDNAMKVLDRAFELGVTDILAFDYWASDLDNRLISVRRQALDKAKAKAELLLSPFNPRPAIINVSEQSYTYSPHDLHATSDHEPPGNVDQSPKGQQPSFKNFRPQRTFSDSLRSQSDFNPKSPAMRPEFTVVSTVHLYYQSPAEDADNE